MCKPLLAALPVILLLLDVWPLKRLSLADTDETGRSLWARVRESSWRRLLMEKIPFFVITILMSAVTVVAQKEIGAMQSVTQLPMLARVANAVNSIWVYVLKMFWPSHLNVMYPIQPIPPVQLAAAAVALALMVAFSLWCLRRRPYVTVGWFWYLVMLTPVLGIVQVGSQ